MLAIVESISHEIIASSEIEGVALNNELVRSSVARKLGIPLQKPIASSCYIDGVIEMALEATVNYGSPLTQKGCSASIITTCTKTGCMDLDLLLHPTRISVITTAFNSKNVIFIAKQ